MTDNTLNSFFINRCNSLDRSDISAYEINVYPESYATFQKTIQNAFFKSELLLKCKMEFERLIKVDIPEPKPNTEISSHDLSLNLIFTGSIKSGRSSLINMFLNAKVMPINVLGSSCCVKICHPKSTPKQISVGIYDWDGWEIEKSSDVEIGDLPKKIEEMQTNLLRNSMGKGHKLARRLHIQLPHWFLKNINIYKCSPIDGMYSFDEPFDIISKTKNPILMHVIDASNGLMEWDRTFLSKIQYKLPHLPIFFIINHVDIQMEILLRDRCIKFGNTPEKARSEHLESESDQTSTDEGASEKWTISDQSIISRQKNLITKSKMQINKLGFVLEKGVSVYYSSISVKEFFKLIKVEDKEMNYYWDLVRQFFITLNSYLEAWMEKMLITSALHVKCQINGVVDAILCQIIYPSTLSQDITGDIYMQNIKKAEKNISDTFTYVIADLEKQTLKVVKEQLKKCENRILLNIPELSTEEPSEIIHILKPSLIKNCEVILIGSPKEFDINDEIHKTLQDQINYLEKGFDKICKAKKIVNFTKYVFNLFRVLKKTLNYPLIVNLPEEIFYGNTKWYKDILRVAARRIRGTSYKPRELVQEMINDMSVMPLIKTAMAALKGIHEEFQLFTRKYQETYKNARGWSIESQDVFRKLLMVDFIIHVIEKSFQQNHLDSCASNLQKLPSFYNDFYEKQKNDKYIHKQINIQSFTSLTDAVNSLCFKRICLNNKYILNYKSTQLLPSGMCLISYAKMKCDLYTAIELKTKWSLKDVHSIMAHLIKAVKNLLPHHKYVQIDLLPESILLSKDASDTYISHLFPYAETNNSIGYNIRTDVFRKQSKYLTALVIQLGMVLSWIVTNNIYICSAIYERESSPELEEIVIQNIKDNIISELKPFLFENLCKKLIFGPEQFETIDWLLRDVNRLNLESEKNTEICDNKLAYLL